MRKLLVSLWLLASGNVTAASLTMTWDANAASDAVVQYRVYQATGTSGFTSVGSVIPPTVTFTTGSLTSGVSYRHYVTAINAVAESAPSNTITNMVTGVPAAPRNLRRAKAPGSGLVAVLNR